MFLKGVTPFLSLYRYQHTHQELPESMSSHLDVKGYTKDALKKLREKSVNQSTSLKSLQDKEAELDRDLSELHKEKRNIELAESAMPNSTFKDAMNSVLERLEIVENDLQVVDEQILRRNPNRRQELLLEDAYFIQFSYYLTESVYQQAQQVSLSQ
jgi:hypothetical protein